MLTYLITGVAAGVIGVLSGQGGLLLARRAGDRRFEQLESDVISRLHVSQQEHFNEHQVLIKEISGMASEITAVKDALAQTVSRTEVQAAFQQVAQAQVQAAQAQVRPMPPMVPAQGERAVNEHLAALDQRFAQMAAQLGLGA
jgi:hypothetical protein